MDPSWRQARGLQKRHKVAVNMKTISMLEFRQNAAAILSLVQQGRSVLLTYRGKTVARLEPVSPKAPREDDPFYRLADLGAEGKPLCNEEMDEIVYGM